MAYTYKETTLVTLYHINIEGKQSLLPQSKSFCGIGYFKLVISKKWKTQEETLIYP